MCEKVVDQFLSSIKNRWFAAFSKLLNIMLYVEAVTIFFIKSKATYLIRKVKLEVSSIPIHPSSKHVKIVGIVDKKRMRVCDGLGR